MKKLRKLLAALLLVLGLGTAVQLADASPVSAAWCRPATNGAYGSLWCKSGPSGADDFIAKATCIHNRYGYWRTAYGNWVPIGWISYLRCPSNYSATNVRVSAWGY